ncbi:MAG: cytochrome P450, partial [Halapricum sp.]
MPSKPPSPEGAPLVGNTLAYASDRFGFIRDARQECGDVFVADLLGLGEVCYLTHPDHFERVLDTERDAFGKSDLLRFALGDGLLAVDGERWERQRAALNEFFYPGRIRSYAREMVSLTEQRIDDWEVGETRSLLEEMTALTLEIMFGTLFDRPLTPDVDEPLRRAAADLNEYFTPISLVLPRWVPTPARRRFQHADETLRNELRRLLDERAAAEEQGDDLLSTLVGLRANGDAAMSEETIVDQLVTIVFAGHETTALAMTYALYELGVDPTIRDRVHRELETVLGGDRPSLADVSDLSVIERVLTETLRLYPPAHTIPRVTTRDVDIGGYRLPEGTQTHLAL